MKKLLIALVALLALTGCSNSNSGAIVDTVSAPVWVSEAQSPEIQIIDVRTAGEFAAGHVANALNIDVEASTFEDEIAKLDKTKTYALYCHSGRRSAIAANVMADSGFKHIINLKGGFIDLLGAGAKLG